MQATAAAAQVTSLVENTRQKMWDINHTTRQTLGRLPGEVFHVVAGGDQLIRLRMDGTGRLLYDRTVSGLSNLKNVKERLAGSPIGTKLSSAKPLLRKAVTGNRDKKVRDYMKEVPQVKMVDKLSFTFGVTCMMVTEFLALRHQELFPQFYYALLVGLLTSRFFEYSKLNEQLFMLDFCYFVNLSVAIQTALFPAHLLWFKANYVLAMGCLMSAIVVWQNSMVFHSLDKLTSFFVHAFPGLTLHLFRWGLIPSSTIALDDSLSLLDVVLLPLGIYVIWQTLYLLITEVILGDAMKADPTLVTSLRYLSKDKKNSLNKITQIVCKRTGIMSREETFDSEKTKTKIIFVTVQGLFTCLTLLPTYFLYSSYTLSFVYIVSIFTWCVWRGGSFYIEVFSERYKLKFVKQDSILDETVPEATQEDIEEEELMDQILEALRAAEAESVEEETKVEDNEDKEDKKGVNDEVDIKGADLESRSETIENITEESTTL